LVDFNRSLQAYAGFHCPELQPGERLAGVASGNWGCGAYRGDAKLKSLLQLMAASQAGRHLAYFTFGDNRLRDQVYHLYRYLTDQQVTVGKCLYILLIFTPQTVYHVISSSE
jgi:poly(ADP-ribose) glycohydrolase